MDGLPSILTAHKSRGSGLQSIDWKGENSSNSSKSKGKKNGEVVVGVARYIGVLKDAVAEWFEEIKLVAAFSIGVLAASAYGRLSIK
jgi:hypothetical protein